MCNKCRKVVETKTKKKFDETKLNQIDHGWKQTNCICGKDIQEYYIFTDGTHEFTFGNICIHNTFSKTKACSITDKKCDICNVTVSYRYYKSHLLTKKHKHNLLKSKYRQCEKCDEYNIKLNASSRYKYCYGCYKEILNKNHKCSMCNKLMFNPKYDICYKCFNKKFENPYEFSDSDSE